MTEEEFPGESLDEAVDWLFDRLEDGARCPCCEQFAKIYRRKINSGMARLLVAQWVEFRTEWTHTSGHFGQISREGAKLAYWGLMEPDGTLREDGGHAGVWRITEAGRNFVIGDSKVQKYAHTYGPRILRHSGPLVSIHQALGTNFNLADLMLGQ